MSTRVTKAHKQAQAKITDAFTLEHKAKYIAGVQEHGGNLWDVPKAQLIEYAIEEVLDLASYLYTLREVLEYSEE